LSFEVRRKRNDVDKREKKMRKLIRILLCAISLQCLFLYVLYSQEKVISPSKYAQDINKAPVAINILTAADIQRSGAKTVADLLKRFPGIWSWTKTRTDQDIGILGMIEDENPRILFLLDGQPISTPMFEGMQWPQFPITLEEVEKIEIIRGGGSALYGANAFTGVINIITKSAKKRENVFYGYIGEEGIHNYTCTIAHAFSDKLSFAFTGGWRQTHKKGSSDPIYNIGEQDFYNTPVLNAKVEYEISQDQKISLFKGYSQGDGGYPASPGDRSIDRVKDWQTLFQNLSYTNTVLKDTTFNIKAAVFNIKQQNFKPYQAGNPEKYKIKARRFYVEANAVTEFIPKHTLVGGVVFQHTMVNSIGLDTNLFPDRKQSYRLYGVFLQDEYNISEPLTLTTSLRYDSYNDISDKLTARGNLMYSFDDKNTLRFSFGESYRRPDIYVMHYYVDFGGGGYFRGGGFDLPSQTAVNYELEYRTRIIPDHVFKAELFQSRFENLYSYQTLTDPLRIRRIGSENKYVIKGFVIEIEGTPWENVFKWYANYTCYQGKNTKANLAMTDIPDYMFNVGFQLFPAKNLYISMDAHFQDGFSAVVDPSITENVTGLPDGTSVKAFGTVDTNIDFFPHKNIELSISIENLLNNQHYEFPLHLKRERTVYGGIRIIW